RYNLAQTLFDNPGLTKESLIADARQAARRATPEQLAQLQQRADSLGLGIKVQAATLKDFTEAEIKGTGSPRRSMATPVTTSADATSRANVGGGFGFQRAQPQSTAFTLGGPQGAQAYGTVPPTFSEAEISPLREQAPGYIPPPREPVASNIKQAGTN